MPERSSSSPNDSSQDWVEIAKTRKRGAGGRTLEVTLAEGSSFFVLAELADKLALHEGETCSRPALEDAAARTAYRLTYERALSLLARREHSRKQLSDKLLQREHPEAEVRTVLDELEADGSLSDIRFAQRWLEGKLRRSPAGKNALFAALMQRGVPREAADQAIRNTAARYPELIEGAAARALAKLKRRDEDPLSLRRKLLRRGFSQAEVRQALEQSGRSGEE